MGHGNFHQRRQERCHVKGFQLVTRPAEFDPTDLGASSRFRGFEWDLRT